MKIEKNVPIPPVRSHSQNGKTAFVRKLKVGQSVVISGTIQAAISTGRNAFGDNGFVTCRKIDNNSVRVWRIK